MKSMKQTLLELKQSKTGVTQRLAIGYALTIIYLLELLEGVSTSLKGSVNRLLLFVQVLEKPQHIIKKSMPKNKSAGQETTSSISSMFEMSQQLYSKNSSQTISPNMVKWTRTTSSTQPQSLMLTHTLSATTIPNKRLEEVLEFYAKNISLIGLA